MIYYLVWPDWSAKTDFILICWDALFVGGCICAREQTWCPFTFIIIRYRPANNAGKTWALPHKIIPSVIVLQSILNTFNILYHLSTLSACQDTQGSHTSQMRKFKGISRVIKGSTAHFYGKLL